MKFAVCVLLLLASVQLVQGIFLRTRNECEKREGAKVGSEIWCKCHTQNPHQHTGNDVISTADDAGKNSCTQPMQKHNRFKCCAPKDGKCAPKPGALPAECPGTPGALETSRAALSFPVEAVFEEVEKVNLARPSPTNSETTETTSSKYAMDATCAYGQGTNKAARDAIFGGTVETGEPATKTDPTEGGFTETAVTLSQPAQALRQLFSDRWGGKLGRKRTLYHGTQESAVKLILSGGFNHAATANYGPGIYTTTSMSHARAYGEFIIKIEVFGEARGESKSAQKRVVMEALEGQTRLVKEPLVLFPVSVIRFTPADTAKTMRPRMTRRKAKPLNANDVKL